MEFTSDTMKTLEADGRDAAYRLAGRQFVKLTREPIVAFLAGHLGPDDPSMRAKIGAFLDTELGEALVSTMLSLGLSTIPATAGEIPKILAKELRVKAMTDVGDVVADLLMGPLRTVISDFLRGQGESTPAALPQESSTVIPMPNFSTVNQNQEIPTVATNGKK